MLTFIFTILMLTVFGRIAIFALKATWTIGKVLFFLIFLPFILIGMVFAGLIYIALPIVIIVGIISLLAIPFKV